MRECLSTGTGTAKAKSADVAFDQMMTFIFNGAAAQRETAGLPAMEHATGGQGAGLAAR